MLAPGTIWETKEWRSDGFAEVARHFLQRGFAVTLIGAARERAACDAVAELAPGAINLAGETTLTELAALIGARPSASPTIPGRCTWPSPSTAPW